MVVVPESCEGGVVVIPEAAGAGSAEDGFSGVARVVNVIPLVEHIGEADFKEDVVLVKIGEEFVPVVHDGAREDVAIGAHEVGIHDVMVFSVKITDGGGFIPDLLAGGGGVSKTGENDGKDEDNDGDDAGGA